MDGAHSLIPVTRFVTCLSVKPMANSGQDLDGVQPNLDGLRPRGDRERGATQAVTVTTLGIDVQLRWNLGVFQGEKVHG